MMNWNTRNTLREGLEWARAYEAGEAEFDPRYEGFIGLANGTVPVSVHTQGFQVVMQTLVMQVQELGLKSFVDHGTFDGYLNAPLAAELGVPIMNGPRPLLPRPRLRDHLRHCRALDGVRRHPRLQHRLAGGAAGGVAAAGGDGRAPRRRHRPRTASRA